eukprot:360521_1
MAEKKEDAGFSFKSIEEAQTFHDKVCASWNKFHNTKDKSYTLEQCVGDFGGFADDLEVYGEEAVHGKTEWMEKSKKIADSCDKIEVFKMDSHVTNFGKRCLHADVVIFTGFSDKSTHIFRHTTTVAVNEKGQIHRLISFGRKDSHAKAKGKIQEVFGQK